MRIIDYGVRPSSANDVVQISGTEWTPNVDGGGNILDSEWHQLPLFTTLKVMTNTLDDVIPTPRYGTKGGSADGSVGIVRAWGGAAIDPVNERMYVSGGGHADSHMCDNGGYKLDSATLRFSVAWDRSALPGWAWRNPNQATPSSSDDGTPRQWVDFTGPTDPWNESRGNPQADGLPSSAHTYWMLTWHEGTEGHPGYVIYHYTAKAVIDLSTGLPDVTHWNRSATGVSSDNVNYSDAVALQSGWKIFQPYGDFYMRAWDYAQREATDWSTEFGGGTDSLGKILYPAATSTSGGFTHGGRLIRNTRTYMRLHGRGEVVCLGVQSEVEAQAFHRRLRLDEAVAATVSYGAGTNWASYFDTLTLTSSDDSHLDFGVQANFASNSYPSPPAHFYAAAAVWDDDTDTAWVWGNRTDSDLYKLTGLASGNTVTTERQASTARPLTTSYNGTFERAMLVKRGAATCLVRVSSTTAEPEIVRVA